MGFGACIKFRFARSNSQEESPKEIEKRKEKEKF
jgi:hypothetical protein